MKFLRILRLWIICLFCLPLYYCLQYKRYLRILRRFFRNIFYKQKRKCIFRFKTGPNWGCGGTPGGYSISVFSNGDIVKCEYLIGRKKPKTKHYLDSVPAMAKIIKAIVKQHKEDLQIIPRRLSPNYLHVCDGACHEFKYGNKRISGCNILSYDEKELEKMKQSNPQRYDENKDYYANCNTVWAIFHEIKGKLGKYVYNEEWGDSNDIDYLIECKRNRFKQSFPTVYKIWDKALFSAYEIHLQESFSDDCLE
ncbi:MAG: hypothetical protein K6G50_13975 [bacterium]|nr:hypothetical protein [bacterium]